MLEVNVTTNENKDVVKAGQIRYNNDGMFVLITYGGSHGRFDAVVLTGAEYVADFDTNTKGVKEDAIRRIYPFVAEGKLEIIK